MRTLLGPVLLVLVLVLWASCTSFDTSGIASSMDATPGADGPDVPIPDAMPPDPDALRICDPGGTQCMSDTLQTCDGFGVEWIDTPCALGCFDTPMAHCADVVPSNGVDMGNGTSAISSMNQGGLVFNTDTGAITTPGGQPATWDGSFTTVNQAGGPTIGVFSVASLELLPGHTLRAEGSNALAIASSGPITIAGVIDISGGPSACPLAPAQRCAGAGGNAGGAAEAAAAGDGGGGAGGGGGGPNGEAGGGGGGHGGAGGVGGSADVSSPGTGGPAFGVNALQPLTGGGGGGGGANEGGTLGGVGGGGGGAAQLISRVSITISGTAPCGIHAGGGGGAGGGGTSAGGGGGGAGGGILLEAPSVTLQSACVLAANGGGGGGAGANNTAGADGALNVQRPAGGNGDASTGGAGSNGANIDGNPGEAGVAEAGGGGGGLGLIRVNTQGGNTFTNNGTVSALESEGTLVIQ